VARQAYHGALEQWTAQYDAWKADPGMPKPAQETLRKPLNAIKREPLPWMLEVTKNALQMAMIHWDQALKNSG
jgi:putative transposase